MTPKVLSVFPCDGKKLKVKFATGEIKLFDVSPYITGDWYGKLSDKKFFDAVIPAGRTVQWPDGQDIAPHELYECSVLLTDSEE